MHTHRRTFLAGMTASAFAGMRPAWSSPATRDTAVFDPATRRRIKLRIRLPEGTAPAPLVIYSPGLGSGVSNGDAWCEAWRRHGFVVVTMAHPATDDRIWDPQGAGFAANLQRALAGGQYAARVADTTFVMQQCLEGSALGMAQRIDANWIGVAGHSYGAITVQALAVDAAEGRGIASRIKAAIALSPGVLTQANARRMAAARLPFFCITGDHDNYVTFSKDGVSRRLGVPLANRLAVYGALPEGQKQLLVIAGADHMSFAGEPVDVRRFSRDVTADARESAAIWRRVSAATTAFWRYYFAHGAGRMSRTTYLAQVRSDLGPRDRFEAG